MQCHFIWNVNIISVLKINLICHTVLFQWSRKISSVVNWRIYYINNFLGTCWLTKPPTHTFKMKAIVQHYILRDTDDSFIAYSLIGMKFKFCNIPSMTFTDTVTLSLRHFNCLAWNGTLWLWWSKWHTIKLYKTTFDVTQLLIIYNCKSRAIIDKFAKTVKKNYRGSFLAGLFISSMSHFMQKKEEENQEGMTTSRHLYLPFIFSCPLQSAWQPDKKGQRTRGNCKLPTILSFVRKLMLQDFVKTLIHQRSFYYKTIFYIENWLIDW